MTSQLPENQVAEIVAAATAEEPDAWTLRIVRLMFAHENNADELAAALLSDEI